MRCGDGAAGSNDGQVGLRPRSTSVQHSGLPRDTFTVKMPWCCLASLLVRLGVWLYVLSVCSGYTLPSQSRRAEARSLIRGYATQRRSGDGRRRSDDPPASSKRPASNALPTRSMQELDMAGFRKDLELALQGKRRSAYSAENRKPWGYWKDKSLIKESVREFWAGLNISSNAIPNEMILRLYDSHGLRHAIYKHGGRETLAYLLNTTYISGDFREAIYNPEVRALMKAGVIQRHNETVLSSKLPTNVENRIVLGPRGGAVLIKDTLEDRRFPRNFSKVDESGRSMRFQNRTVWTLERVTAECYSIAEEHARVMHVPPIFFPKLSDLVNWRRANMIAAIQRLGGYDLVVQELGFIPYNQWAYFCRFYMLMKDLQKYLDAEEGGARYMPRLRAVKAAGYDRLWTEIARNGGRKVVAARVGLPLKSGTGERGEFWRVVNYGAFDFDFAIELFDYIMAKCWSQHPRERARARDDQKANLFLPTTEELLTDKRKDLVEKIMQYGGYECVARRLQLGFRS